MKNTLPFRTRAYWNLKRFSQFRIYSALIGLFVFFVGYIIKPAVLRAVVMAAGVICMLSVIPVFLLFWRCPHCHALRPWHYSAKDQHCTICGKEIESP